MVLQKVDHFVLNTLLAVYVQEVVLLAYKTGVRAVLGNTVRQGVMIISAFSLVDVISKGTLKTVERVVDARVNAVRVLNLNTILDEVGLLEAVSRRTGFASVWRVSAGAVRG